ncbi:DUF190 domain-containing protein [Lactobacillus selangorensis]|nr:DUF190 domain-containing protein [Lactobacillus selangorensis]
MKEVKQMKYLLRIIVDELDEAYNGQNLAHLLLKFLWRNHVPGVTLRKGKMSLDGHAELHEQVAEDEPFNNLPLIFEAIIDDEVLDRIMPLILRMIPNGQVSLTFEEETIVPTEHYDIKIFTKADNKWFRKDHYEDILDLFQQHQVTWATVTEGVAGYGADHVIHRQEKFHFAHSLPIVIEGIVSGATLPDLLKAIQPLLQDGVVFTTKVDVRENTTGGNVNG